LTSAAGGTANQTSGAAQAVSPLATSVSGSSPKAATSLAVALPATVPAGSASVAGKPQLVDLVWTDADAWQPDVL
jgi:hypothetical protein